MPPSNRPAPHWRSSTNPRPPESMTTTTTDHRAASEELAKALQRLIDWAKDEDARNRTDLPVWAAEEVLTKYAGRKS